MDLHVFSYQKFFDKYNLVVQTFEEQMCMLLPRQTWLKLIELFMAMVLEDNKDKRCLFILSFIKNNF